MKTFILTTIAAVVCAQLTATEDPNAPPGEGPSLGPPSEENSDNDGPPSEPEPSTGKNSMKN